MPGLRCPLPPHRPPYRHQGLRTVPEESSLCFTNSLLPRGGRSAQLWTLPPQQAAGSPFTQSRAGNNPRLRCLPAKAKVHARSSAFHSGAKALETRCSPGHGDALERKERVGAAPLCPERGGKTSHQPQHDGTREDEGKAGSGIASLTTRVLGLCSARRLLGWQRACPRQCSWNTAREAGVGARELCSCPEGVPQQLSSSHLGFKA